MGALFKMPKEVMGLQSVMARMEFKGGRFESVLVPGFSGCKPVCLLSGEVG